MTPIPQPAVLVVDDEHIIADTLVMVLKGSGFEAMAVYRGEDALEIVKKSPPDALVCDIMLGDANGIEVATEVRANCPDCKVILISGAEESAELLEGARASGQEFEVLAKPFHPTMLIERLREVIGPSTEAA